MLKILLPLIVIFFISCESEPKRAEYDPARMERYIKYNNAKFEKAWVDYNSRKVIYFFTPGACIYPGSLQGICDTAGIKNYQQQLQQRGVRKNEMLSLKFEKENNLVKEEGMYNFRDSNNAIIENGKYSIVWKQYKGYWRYDEVRWMAE